MGFTYQIHVCFACDTNDEVAALAKKHLPALRADKDADLWGAPIWFLESLAERTGDNLGGRGGLSLWGMCQRGPASVFCEVLTPFWKELLSGVEGGPNVWEHVIVFEEPEQSGAANAYEIFWQDPQDPNEDRAMIGGPNFDPSKHHLVIKKHKGLPFKWNQI